MQPDLMKLLIIAVWVSSTVRRRTRRRCLPTRPRAPRWHLGERATLPDIPVETLYLKKDNWWNLDVSQAPVDPNNDALIAWLAVQESSIGKGKLHPDFTPRSGFVCDGAGHATEGVGCVHGVPRGERPGRLPDSEKHVQSAVHRVTGSKDGDRHLIILDRDNWFLYELVQARWTGTQWKPTAERYSISPPTSAGRRLDVHRCGGAGRIAGTGALRRGVRPASIKHAFRVACDGATGTCGRRRTAPVTRGRASDGHAVSAESVEGHFRLSARDPEIFQAMKTHGLIVADNGGNMYVTGTLDQRWTTIY